MIASARSFDYPAKETSSGNQSRADRTKKLKKIQGSAMGARIYEGKYEFVLENFCIKIGATSYLHLSDILLLKVLSEYDISRSLGVVTSGNYSVHLP